MTKSLNIVQINDTHANLYEHGDVIYTADGIKVEKMGGYPRILTKIKEYKSKFPHEEILILDNGDTIHGTVEAVESKGKVMIPYLKKLGVDAMTFHWDSAYTPTYLKEFEKNLGYPILASNVYHSGTKDQFFEPSTIIEKNDLRIGVVGIASNIIQSNMPENFWQGADFVDGIEETQAEVDKLRSQNVDLVVVLSHLGYPQDIALLQQVTGIDLYLSGHTHNRLKKLQNINGTYIIQSGSLASSLTYLRIEVEKGIKSIKHEFVMLDSTVEMDQEMLTMFNNDEILVKYREKLKEQVGETTIDLHRASSFYGSMDFFLNDAIRKATSLSKQFQKMLAATTSQLTSSPSKPCFNF